MDSSKFYDARVEEVHSGDDLVLLADLGIDGLYKRVRGRLFGVDTPNAHRASSDTEAYRVRDEVRQLTASCVCKIQLIAQGRGGWVIVLHVVRPDGTSVNVNEMLIGRGYIFKGKSTPISGEGTT